MGDACPFGTACAGGPKAQSGVPRHHLVPRWRGIRVGPCVLHARCAAAETRDCEREDAFGAARGAVACGEAIRGAASVEFRLVADLDARTATRTRDGADRLLGLSR
eukprot:2505190-Prymnesium_polylepis.1